MLVLNKNQGSGNMINAKIVLPYIASIAFVMAAGLLPPQAAFGRGALSMEGESCVLKIGPYKLHFTGYAPETKPSQDFCEDIPDAGRTVIAFNHAEKALRRMSMGMRIIRDDKHLGANARYEQLGDQKEIEASTLLYKAPEVYPRGNATVELNLDKGNYIGVVTLSDPETNQQFASAFPLGVGFGEEKRNRAFIIMAFLALIGVGGAVYFVALRPHSQSKPSQENIA
jgi:hypothetical protein